MSTSNIKLVGLREALDTMDPRIVTTAARYSINKVTKSGKSAASEQIRQLWNIKKSDLDPRIEVVEARRSGAGAYLIFGGKGIATSYFDARQFTASTMRRLTKKGETTKTRKTVYKLQGVRTEVRVGKAKALPGAFLVKLKSGHIGVMQRRSDKKMKKKNKAAIMEKGVVSIASMFRQPRVFAAFLNKVYAQWATVFPHELERRRLKLEGS